MRLKRVLGAVLSGAMVLFPGCLRRRRRRGDHSGIQGRRETSRRLQRKLRRRKG